ncbi:MAG: SURF1 family protein [Pseudomonadota bacterium]
MMRILAPLLFGLAGVALLMWLGVWQMQRLAWKEGVLSEIEAKIGGEPISLPLVPQENLHKYRSVELNGKFGEGALRVLVSRKRIGAGYRLISPFATDGRVILVDRGFIRLQTPVQPAPPGLVLLRGNLHWPDDRNSSTPQNDVAGNTWFARDLKQMADLLGAEPVLVVVREMSQPDETVTPLPVDTSGIPNDHLQYAITWFSLAVVWVIMTGYYIFRSRNPAKG